MSGLSITISPDTLPVETVVDASIRAFDAWFRSIGNDPLVGSERAMVKTYLFYALRIAKTEALAAGEKT